ncbi:MAG: type I restriction-modification protein subunit S [Nitrospirales bacterium]|nr:MAG: type I restriction-modification protein subunit S [Nitrospirales bacterium]
MKLPTYPKYKPSGEAWVPELPESWNLVRLRWLSARYAGGTPDKSNSSFWDDGDIPWLNSGAVNDGYITEPSEYITREGFLGSSAKWIPKGALVMALAGQGKTKGMVAQLGFAATCNQSMAAIIPIHRIQARYLYWWLTTNYFNIRNMAGGEARDGLNLELLGSIPCPVPEKDEQCAIADFLDRETARIDTLVAKKRTLIERLKEKRTALISRTVTRGLPPDAARAAGLDPHPRLKPSGIDWLGDIPESWETERMSRVCNRVTDGAHISPDLSSADYPFVSTVDIENGRIDYVGSLHTSVECYEFLVRSGCKPLRGDVLFSKDGTVGRTAIVNFELDFVVASSLVIISPRPRRLESRFLNYWLNNSLLQQNIMLQLSGAALRRISVEKVSRLPVVLPGIAEQRFIADFLDRETAKIDRMTTKVEAAIERLQEYRTALITAGVTGKIDVREAVA